MNYLTIKGFEITLVWIPAHKEITGNKLANKLAKKVINSGKNTVLGIFAQDIKILERPTSFEYR